MEGKLPRVEGGTVAFVLRKAIVWIEDVIEAHQAVAHNLGHDGGAANHPAALIAVDHWPTRHVHGRGYRSIDKDKIRTRRQIFDGPPHRSEGGLQDIAPVDLLRRRKTNADVGLIEDNLEGSQPLARGQAL